MKKKKLNGLSLNKKRVSELNSAIQNMLKGGTGSAYASNCCGGGGRTRGCGGGGTGYPTQCGC